MYKISLITGDGIGPELSESAISVLNTIHDKLDLKFDIDNLENICNDLIKKNNYDWWIKRIEHNLKFFDYVRIDHFRGFAAYWEVKANEDTAINGRWTPGPGKDFFKWA